MPWRGSYYGFGGPFRYLFGFGRSLLGLFVMGLGPRASLLGVTILLGAWLYAMYGPQAPTVAGVRRQVGESLVRQAVAQFPWDKDVGTVRMLPIQGDWGAFLTDSTRKRVEDTGHFQLATEPSARRVAKDLRLYTTGEVDDQHIRDIVRDMSEDTLLIGRLRSYEEDAREAVGELNFVFISKRTGASTPVHVTRHLSKGLLHAEYLLSGVRFGTTGQRIFLWFLSVLVFPLLAAPLTIWVARRQQAMSSLVLMSVYVTLLIAWTLVIVGPVERWWQGLMMIGLTTAIIGYLLIFSEAIAAAALRRR